MTFRIVDSANGCNSFAVGLYPLWEGRKSMAHTSKSIWRDMTGKGKPVIQGRTRNVEEEEEVSEEKLPSRE